MSAQKIKTEKLRDIFNSGLEYKFTEGGFVLIDGKLLITQSKSLWRLVGTLDWFPFYGLKTLLEAYKTDALEQYKQNQINTKRKILALPKKNVWGNKIEEKRLKDFYQQRSKKFGRRKKEMENE
jgi:hypothetical protein